MLEVEGQSGAGLVSVVMTCRHDVKRVTIDPSLLADEARGRTGSGGCGHFDDAVRKAEATSQERMAEHYFPGSVAARNEAALFLRSLATWLAIRD